LRLDRFREMSARLPDPGDVAAWIEAFEACVAGDDFGTVRLTVSHEWFNALHASNRRSDGGPTWDGLLERVSDEIFDELGLTYPPPRVEADSALAAPWFRCEWNDLALPPRLGLREQDVLVGDTVGRLAKFDIPGERAVHPLTGRESAVIAASHAELARQAGFATWTWQEHLALCLSEAIRGAAGAFVSRRLYDLYSLRLGEFSPALLGCLEERFAAPFVVQVLRALLAEGIGVRNLSEVFRAMLEPRAVMRSNLREYIVFGPPSGGVAADCGSGTLAGMTPQHYAEFVRTGLKRQIAYLHTRAPAGGAQLIVYLLGPDTENRLARGMDAAESRAFLKAAREEFESLPPTARVPVVLTSIETRREVRRLLFPEFPGIAVVAYQELAPELNIQPIARIEPQF
jgi:type III secretion protein V